MISFKHKFRSPYANSPDVTLLGPKAWNDEHDVSANPFTVFGFDVNGLPIELNAVAVPGTDGTVLLGHTGQDPAFSSNPVLGVAGSVLGSLTLAGNTGGTFTLQPQTSAGNWVLQPPNGVAANGQYLTTDASGVGSWGISGDTRVTTDFSVTSSNTLVNVTGLSVPVKAGLTYSFEAYLSCTNAAAGGIQAAIAGTATATNIIYDGWAVADNAIKGQTHAAALATAVASTTTTATSGNVILIKGTITVNAAGTLTVQFAQNTSNGTPSVVKRGSYFIVKGMP